MKGSTRNEGTFKKIRGKNSDKANRGLTRKMAFYKDKDLTAMS